MKCGIMWQLGMALIDRFGCIFGIAWHRLGLQYMHWFLQVLLELVKKLIHPPHSGIIHHCI